MPDRFIKKVEGLEAKIGVVGLGYVGLPLVMEFCRAGFNVLGLDIDRKKIDSLKASETYIRHIPSEKIAEINASGKFDATTDFARSAE
jgi:UDP-N-acetyl-D-glucosamine dehydrogenase